LHTADVLLHNSDEFRRVLDPDYLPHPNLRRKAEYSPFASTDVNEDVGRLQIEGPQHPARVSIALGRIVDRTYLVRLRNTACRYAAPLIFCVIRQLSQKPVLEHRDQTFDYRRPLGSLELALAHTAAAGASGTTDGSGQ
jgi:hypothetical protein